ncbi:MAG: hypothetical protein ACOCYT_04855 [Chloroflexota bacterium]
MAINASSILGNTAPGSGGGGLSIQGGAVTIQGHSPFENNSAPNGGGAISTSSTLTINGAVFSGNTALMGPGGAILDLSGNSYTIANAIFTGNNTSQGTLMTIATGAVTFSNVTITAGHPSVQCVQ